MIRIAHFSFFFFFNDTATTEIYTLSLHDALPISNRILRSCELWGRDGGLAARCIWMNRAAFQTLFIKLRPASQRFSSNKIDRKSTRLNSSHLVISYAVFCLKKKKKMYNQRCS